MEDGEAGAPLPDHKPPPAPSGENAPHPVAPDVALPSSLSAPARQEWRNFLTYPEHRAFAVSGGGHFAYVYGRSSDKEARKLALERCEELVSRGDRCDLVEDKVTAVGDSRTNLQ